MDNYGKHSTEPAWHAPRRLLRSAVPAAIWSWLLDPSSLTRRLQQACGDGFRVQVLQQRWELPQLSEARVLGIKTGRHALVREVRLLCGDRPWVFARTVIPAATLTGRERRLGHLGTRPLGGLLFRERSMRRGELEVARIMRGQPLFRLACAGLPAMPTELWGRRSLFFLHDKPLLVCEMFLPGVGEE
ncbi:MAG: chorismate lyase [Pseudomonadota bacterium]